MTMAEYNEVMGLYATAFRQLNDVFKRIAEIYPEGSGEVEVADPYSNAQTKFREGEHWMRDLRTVLLNKTSEMREASEKRMREFQEQVDKAMQEKEAANVDKP